MARDMAEAAVVKDIDPSAFFEPVTNGPKADSDFAEIVSTMEFGPRRMPDHTPTRRHIRPIGPVHRA